MKDSLFEHFYELIQQIPKGKVATYGDIARMADCKSARAVGFALNQLPENSGIPWQRVVNSKGEISLKDFAKNTQQILLEEEGVVFNNNKIDLKTFRWDSGLN